MSSMLGASLPRPLEIRVAMMTTKARGKLSFASNMMMMVLMKMIMVMMMIVIKIIVNLSDIHASAPSAKLLFWRENHHHYFS